ncbi:MAG: hypothetical protein ACFFC9_05725 [Promethearchaeota archaeon]
MSEKGQVNPEIEKIKDFVNDKRLDDAVKIIALYLGDANDNNYLNRLEDVIETLLNLHGGHTVIKSLIEKLIIDLPSLLENLSKRDSVLRYSFLLLLKSICETECNLFLPFSEELLNSEDPNVREAYLQLIIFMASGEQSVDDESLIKTISLKLDDPKEFVVEKAVQALKTIGKNNPSLITRIITNKAKEDPENERLTNVVDSILKAIVSVEKIDEIVEEENEEEVLEKQEEEIKDKEIELKKKEIEIKKKKLELEEKEKQLEEKLIQEKEKTLKEKEELIAQEIKIPKEIPVEDLPKKVKKIIKKEEEEILDKEFELKKKDLEIKKKKLDLELKEKELEEIQIQEKEKALKIKEELLAKESELSQVEIELTQKKIEEKEQKLREEEQKRAEDKLKDIEKKVDEEKK